MNTQNNDLEVHMLIESDPPILKLDDGSQWTVQPGDMPTVATWIPTATLEIKMVDSESMWPYEITKGDISVRASRLV